MILYRYTAEERGAAGGRIALLLFSFFELLLFVVVVSSRSTHARTHQSLEYPRIRLSHREYLYPRIRHFLEQHFSRMF
jgi:hypothetical protein